MAIRCIAVHRRDARPALLLSAVQAVTMKKAMGVRAALAARASRDYQAPRHGPPTRGGLLASRTILFGSEDGDWTNPEERGEHANAALTLYKNDKVMIKTFEKFGLDPANPYHWRRLLGHLCDVVYVRGRGRPKKWDAQRQAHLLADFDSKKEQYPSLTELGVCAKMRTIQLYSRMSAKTLARRLADARKARGPALRLVRGK